LRASEGKGGKARERANYMWAFGWFLQLHVGSRHLIGGIPLTPICRRSDFETRFD
jgi:hypothetical protein